jgi:hypothetical protein
VDPGPGVYDHDLDSQPHRPAGPRAESIAPYQKLVVNPFLAVLAVVITIAIERWALENHYLGIFQIGFGLIALEFFLVQYHCRDCGATGFLFRVGRHACPAVVARLKRDERPRFRGPGVRVQLVAWLILVASAVILVLVS